jgi:4-aminobutyrate aminotransferase/(S)-3-amino-2-methylpropionate transaminase
MRALEIDRDREALEPDAPRTQRIIALAAQRGLLVLSAGLYGNVIRTLMPLTTTDDELNEALDVLDSCLHDAA